MTNLSKKFMSALGASITDYVNNNIAVSVIQNFDFNDILNILNKYKTAILK